ncbi:MATE family efflux transporter [Acutalibacter sp. 1XD8-36]|uniref:MATE family efflux transporter n=1 Tax=Acutalibacter sp. 1XD8-36 TaxID=2320852 RepID=UPI0014136F42|nr:MATE family efflux transporter [Acutalibacter sp. 1XD8-36]NBJ88090.1 MATE family efflux transporter [Acutalibacter sp. 1XD8-36]
MFTLAVPAITAQLVNMLYNIVDRIYIGHIPEIGSNALTGVGICFPIIILIMAFSSLVAMGGAPQAAIAMGQQNNEKAERILGNCFTSLLIVAVALTAVFLIFGEPILWAFGASENTIGYANDYLQIYIIGTVFVQIALGMNMFITTQGFAKTSMLTVVIGAALNIILDPVFIFMFNMGVQGAALATIISQGVSAAWVIRFLTGKRTNLHIKKHCMRISPQIMLPVLALGVSPFIMQSTESLLSVVLNTSLLKYGGDIAVGAYTVLGSVIQIVNLPMQGLFQGAQPITSYNYGAQKFDRVKKSVRLLTITAVTYGTVFWLALMLVPQVFVGMFTSDAALTETTVWAMRIFLAGVFAFGFQGSFQNSFLALGQAKVSLLMALLRKIVLLIPLIFIMPVFFENKLFGVFIAEPIADILAAIVTTIAFITWARKNLNKPKKDT